MKRLFSAMGFPLLAILIYFFFQVICSIPLAFMLKDPVNPNMTPVALSLFAANLLTMLAIIPFKVFGQRKSLLSTGTTSSSLFVISIVGMLCGIFSINFICEFFNLNDIAIDMLMGMSENILGILAICIIGPICEELLFRGAIMYPMLRKGINPAVCIFVSALIFGIIHFNPAQIPVAMLVGILFGIIYYYTKSLVATSICHIINNSTSVLLMSIYGENIKEMTMSNIFGSTTHVIIMAIIFAALSAVLLRYFCKNQGKPNWKEGDF